MDSNKIKVIVFAVLAMFVALYLGISAATAQEETIAWVAGGATLMTCILLGRRIWLLIPLMAALDLTVRVAGQPSSLLVGELLVLGFSAILLLMRKLPYRFAFGEIEWLLLALFLMVAQAYLRNPVGLNIFGGDTVGGKPYFIFTITCLTAVLLCGIRVPENDLPYIFRLSIFGGLANLGIGIVGQIIPTFGYYTGASYVNTGETDYTNMGTAVDEGAAGRIPHFSALARNLSLWISCYISPVAAIVRPLWAILCITAAVAGAFSGFRTALATVLVTLFIGTFYRGGRGQVVFGLFGLLASLAVLAITNLIVPLPPNIQRALSFLPGTWEERYLADAKGSTDWRVEIWKEALTSERWIQNKWLGDGLGFSARELQASLSETRGISGFDAQRESIMASGDYHSTAVNTIRTCGYAGLALILWSVFRVAVHGHRLIKRHRNTRWFPLALFVGIPPILAFILFFMGASNFLQVAASLFLSGAMIRLLNNNIPSETQLPAAGSTAPVRQR